MRYLLLLGTLLALLTGCSCVPGCDNLSFPWKREKGATRCEDGLVFEGLMYHIQHLAVKYQKESRLKLEDSNIWYDSTLEKIRLDFSSMALLDFCEARFLLVDVVEDLRTHVEEDEELMAKFHQTHLNPDIFEVYIDFKSYFGKKVDYDYVGWISLVDGCANYYAFDMRTDTLDWWHRRSETYLESRAIAHAMRVAEEDWAKAIEEDPDLLEEDRFRLKI